MFAVCGEQGQEDKEARRKERVNRNQIVIEIQRQERVVETRRQKRVVETETG